MVLEPENTLRMKGRFLKRECHLPGTFKTLTSFLIISITEKRSTVCFSSRFPLGCSPKQMKNQSLGLYFLLYWFESPPLRGTKKSLRGIWGFFILKSIYIQSFVQFDSDIVPYTFLTWNFI
jgi:hypothetical protein